MSTPKLTGQQSRCAACGLTFTHTNSFDAHRYGPYTARRCLTADELRERGMLPNSRGFWRKPLPSTIPIYSEQVAP